MDLLCCGIIDQASEQGERERERGSGSRRSRRRNGEEEDEMQGLEDEVCGGE